VGIFSGIRKSGGLLSIIVDEIKVASEMTSGFRKKIKV